MPGAVKKSTLWAISICGMAAIFSSTLAKTPALPLYASHLGANDAQVGLIAAASTVPGIIISYLAGTLSDRYGWKKLLITSLIIFSTAPFLYLIVSTPLELAGVRFYHGFATAIFGPVAMAAVISYSGQRKGEMLSLFSSSTMIGRALAPFLGGLLLASWHFDGLFLVCAAAGTVALIMCVRLKEPQNESHHRETKASIITINFWQLISHRQLLLVGLLEAVIFFTYGAFEVIFPLYAKGIGLTVWQIGIIMGVQLLGVIIFKPIFGRFSDRVGRMPLILLGLGVSALSIGGISYSQNIIALTMLNVAFGLGFALVTSSTRPLVTDIVEKNQTGASLGIISTLMDMGQVAGPVVVGLVAYMYGYKISFLLLSLILASAAFYSYIFIYFKRSQEKSRQ